MSLRLFLIRHGETAWCLTGRHTGCSEIPLTTDGEAGARRLAPRLRDIPFARVLTSPRERAQRTCELAGLGAAAVVEPDLAEWDYGDYEGRISADIHRERPDWSIFRDGCPAGESPAQVSARADRLVARLRLLQGNVALFSHGHFGRVLGVRWIGQPVNDGRHLLFGPAALSVLGYDRDRRAEPVIVRWNTVPDGPAGPGANPDIADARFMKQRALDRWENEGGEIPPPATASG